jgi:diamine N-acetyltransferase
MAPKIKAVKFRDFQREDVAELRQMIFQLYAEDPEGEAITGDKIDNTVRELSDHPEKGKLLVFDAAGEIVGYAIVVYAWSNELGGDVFHIDELFVKAAWRSRGIASRFIEDISSGKQGKLVALEIEVTPSNPRALACYRKLGFEPSQNTHLMRRT